MADEHGPDAPGDDAKPKTLGERVTAAVEDAFIDTVKARFVNIMMDGYGNEGARFRDALKELKAAREKAVTAVKDVFG